MPASTQPIYVNSVIHWRKRLAGTEVVPRVPTTTAPILIGSAGDFGAMIHGIDVQHLGNSVATVLRIYTQPKSQTGYDLELEMDLPAITTASESAGITRVVVNGLPAIISNNLQNRALHLGPGESLYVALGTAIASGINVFVRGGNY